MAPEAKVDISVRKAQVQDCDPDVDVSPAQLHVKRSTHVTWKLTNPGTLMIEFTGKGHRLVPMVKGGVVTIEIPKDAPFGTYSYVVKGTATVSGQERQVNFKIPNCPEIIIQ